MMTMPFYHSLQSPSILKEAESFCTCRKLDQSSHFFGRRIQSRLGSKLLCSCGEESNVHEWTWDKTITSVSTRLSMNDREVQFHPTYSNGTAAMRGNMPFVINNDYYWEIKMLTPVYGTDVMVGVGTTNANLLQASHNYCSLLGSDEESWGYSYSGSIQHKGKKVHYGPPFGHGSIVGVHLDMWKGTLEFYLNRKPLGVAFTSLRGQTLYPMICSTTAKTSMRVTYAASMPSSLQLMCLKVLSSNSRLVKLLRSIPFLRSLVDREYWWLIPAENDIEIIEDASKDDDDGDFLNLLSEDSDDESGDVNLTMCMDMIRELSQTSESCESAKVKRKCKKKSLKKELEQSSNQNPGITHDCHCTGRLLRSHRRLCNYCDIIL